MEMREMPLAEKYDKLLDDYLLANAVGYTLHKELKVVDQSNDLWVQVQKKLFPSVLGVAFKVLKTISPGKAFKQVTNQYVYSLQRFIPVSNIEVTMTSDREATVRITNCPVLKRQRTLLKKAGLDIGPRYLCEIDATINPEVANAFGVDLNIELEENGCTTTAKLK
ncbi:MAG: hypothetical protein O2V44_07635 [Candidatus Bathyarchaeota archaeon]|nr:hypothetical protein [Candidatus Bathyarchaeota archaeon]